MRSKFPKIILSGNPISTQHAYGQHGKIRFMKKIAKELKESYRVESLTAWRRKPLFENLEVEIHLFFGNKRVRDWDNYHKISMDALTGIVWIDDSQIKKATIFVDYDKTNPRIEVSVNTLPVASSI